MMNGVWGAALVLALGACGGDKDDGGANTLGATSSADDDGDGGTTPTPTGGADDGATSSDPTSSGSGDDMMTTSPPDTGACDMSGAMGAECTEDCECASGKCFYVPAIGGSCGECIEDGDCPDGGCTPPNPLADPPVGAVCNMGAAGEGCMSDDVCQDGLVCGTIVDAQPILTVSTCGECKTDADCTGGQLCSPTIDILAFSGERLCVDPGSVENGQACDHTGSGNDACNSGICHVVTIKVVQVGVCGDCNVDADCMGPGEVCTDPEIDTMTGEVTPPVCAVP